MRKREEGSVQEKGSREKECKNKEKRREER